MHPPTPAPKDLDSWRFEVARGERLHAALNESRIASLPGIEAAACSLPLLGIGGDYFDLLPLPTGGLRMIVGDAMGKGFGAAILIGMVRTAVRLLHEEAISPGQLLQRVNATLHGDLQRTGSFVTLCCVDYIPSAQTIVAASAGALRPLSLRAGAEAPELIMVRGTALGLLRHREYGEITLAAGNGDLLVLYTDGITELRSRAGADLTLDGLKQLLTSHKDLEPPHLLDALLVGANRHAGTGSLGDDLTLLVARFSPALPIG